MVCDNPRHALVDGGVLLSLLLPVSKVAYGEMVSLRIVTPEFMVRVHVSQPNPA